MSAILNASSSNGKLSAVVLVSRLDAALARDFKSAIEAAWEDNLREVEIDLGNVEFVDSSGIGALLSVYRKLPPGAGTTRLVNVRPSVQSVIELLRLHRVFEISS